MQCPRCQHENSSRAKFCEECATPLAQTCSNCGTQLSPTAKFCPECARPIDAGAAQPHIVSPGAYTPKHLAEKILTSKAALEGERKQVTVLFADLKGSMELLADRDPEEARKLLDPVLEHMMEAVHRYEGTVNQVMGDGIMALFGAPLAHEDHAVRACYAALRMQETVKQYAEGVRRQEGITVRIRVGLNSGEVVVRAIGSDLHMDYTAVGQTTHLAARMEQLADPGTILLPSATLALAEDFIQVRPQGPTPVKGMTEPVDVYELLGATPVRSRFHAHAARGLTAFVGRTSEVSQLAEALDLARSGRGQVIAVVGEPGVGKSRLFWEFGHSHRTGGCLVLESTSVSYGKATTYLPVIELLRGYFQIEPRDDTRKIREKITGKLLSLDRSLELAISPLLSLLDVPLEDAEWTRLDPAQRRQRTLDALKRLCLRESQVQPLVVVFEDLHWIDGETQAVLDGLVESLPTARVLLLVNYRPEYQHGWGSKTYYRQLRVDALPVASAETLLEALLGKDPSLASLKGLLIQRTEGNPLFLEESVRTLVETRALVGEPGAYRLTRALDSFEIPATAQAIIAARIDRLSPEDKRLLQAAAVIGKDVPLTILHAIADEPEDHIRPRLARLQAAEFLYESRLFPDVEYTFKHALTHEVAYGGLLQHRRSTLHGRIVSVLELLHGDRANEHAERLADHAFKSEDWLRAARYLRNVGAKALSKAAYRNAVDDFGRAVAALEKIPKTTDTLGARIDARFGLHDALLPLGMYDKLHEVVRQAEDLAQTLGDRRRLSRAYSYLSHHAWIALGDNARAAEFASQALQSGGHENRALEIAVAFYLGQINLSRGDLRAAIDAFTRCITLSAIHSSRYLDIFFAVNARSWTGYPYAHFGLFDEALGLAEQGLRIAEESGNSLLVVTACTGLGHIHMSRGAMAKALEYLERGLSIPGVRDLPQRFGPLGICMAHTLALIGRADDAVRIAEEALQIASMIVGCRSWWLAVLAHAYLAAGRHSDAVGTARQAVDLAKARGEKAFEAQALYVLALAVGAETPEDLRDADMRLHEALTRAQSLGMQPLVAHCQNALGRLHRTAGKEDEARLLFHAAASTYRELDMHF